MSLEAHKYIVKRSRSNRLSEGSNLGNLSVENSERNIERFSPQSKSNLSVAGFSSLTIRICRFSTPKSRIFSGALSRLDFGVDPCHPWPVSRVPPEISRRDSKTLAGGKRSATTGMRPGRSGDPEGIEESASDVRSSQLCDPFRIKTLPAQQPGGGATLTTGYCLKTAPRCEQSQKLIWIKAPGRATSAIKKELQCPS